MGHKHEFHVLWCHWGRYGPQDEHWHPCFGEKCERVLIGKGWDCDGVKATHEIGGMMAATSHLSAE